MKTASTNAATARRTLRRLRRHVRFVGPAELQAATLDDLAELTPSLADLQRLDWSGTLPSLPEFEVTL